MHCRDAMMIRGAIDPNRSYARLKSRTAAGSCHTICDVRSTETLGSEAARLHHTCRGAAGFVDSLARPSV
jgi:hypothetical protein